MTTVLIVGNSEGSRRCDGSCHGAAGDVCRCVCEGRYHGIARGEDPLDPVEVVQQEAAAGDLGPELAAAWNAAVALFRPQQLTIEDAMREEAV